MFSTTRTHTQIYLQQLGDGNFIFSLPLFQLKEYDRLLREDYRNQNKGLHALLGDEMASLNNLVSDYEPSHNKEHHLGFVKLFAKQMSYLTRNYVTFHHLVLAWDLVYLLFIGVKANNPKITNEEVDKNIALLMKMMSCSNKAELRHILQVGCNILNNNKTAIQARKGVPVYFAGSLTDRMNDYVTLFKDEM